MHTQLMTVAQAYGVLQEKEASVKALESQAAAAKGLADGLKAAYLQAQKAWEEAERVSVSSGEAETQAKQALAQAETDYHTALEAAKRKPTS